MLQLHKQQAALFNRGEIYTAMLGRSYYFALQQLMCRHVCFAGGAQAVTAVPSRPGADLSRSHTQGCLLQLGRAEDPLRPIRPMKPRNDRKLPDAKQSIIVHATKDLLHVYMSCTYMSENAYVQVPYSQGP
jgi:hypothetical protein